MGQMIVNVIFKILNFIANLFLGPIFSAVTSLFPALQQFFIYVGQFIGTSFTYVGFFIKLLMIPKFCIVPLVALGATIFTFNLSIRVIGLGMAIYHYFKP